MEEKEGEKKDKYWQQTDVYRKRADLSGGEGAATIRESEFNKCEFLPQMKYSPIQERVKLFRVKIEIFLP